MLRNYLKIAMKVLLRRKFFTFISLFAVSFALMVLMVATAMLDHVFAPRQPETRADRTLVVMNMCMSGPRGSRTGGAGYGFLDRYVRGIPGAELVSVSSLPSVFSGYVNGERVRSFLKRTDGEFWRILDFEFAEGGPFTVEEDAQASHVAVINEATRDRYFGGAPAVGRTLEVDGQSFRVVGVVRNVPITRPLPFADVWIPINTTKGDAFRREFVGDFMALILAPEKSRIPAIQGEFEARLATVQLPDPKNFTKLSGGAETFFETISRFLFSPRLGESHPTRLWVLIVGGALLFMTFPALNLVNINLSRILERASEIGVRKAFGATSRTLVGQFVVENVFLTLVGGLLGWVPSAAALGALNRSGLIPYAKFDLNLRVLVYGVATAVFFGVLSGVYPAWRMSRLHPVEALRGRSE